MRKVTSDLESGGLFDGYSDCLRNLQLASHDLVEIWQKKRTKTEIPNPNFGNSSTASMAEWSDTMSTSEYHHV